MGLVRSPQSTTRASLPTQLASSTWGQLPARARARCSRAPPFTSSSSSCPPCRRLAMPKLRRPPPLPVRARCLLLWRLQGLEALHPSRRIGRSDRERGPDPVAPGAAPRRVAGARQRDPRLHRPRARPRHVGPRLAAAKDRRLSAGFHGYREHDRDELESIPRRRSSVYARLRQVRW